MDEYVYSWGAIAVCAAIVALLTWATSVPNMGFVLKLWMAVVCMFVVKLAVTLAPRAERSIKKANAKHSGYKGRFFVPE